MGRAQAQAPALAEIGLRSFRGCPNRGTHTLTILLQHRIVLPGRRLPIRSRSSANAESVGGKKATDDRRKITRAAKSVISSQRPTILGVDLESGFDVQGPAIPFAERPCLILGRISSVGRRRAPVHLLIVTAFAASTYIVPGLCGFSSSAAPTFLPARSPRLHTWSKSTPLKQTAHGSAISAC